MKFPRRVFKFLPFGLKVKVLDWYLRRSGIEVKIAETPAELEQVYRLRFEVYSAEDYIDPEDYPDRQIKDKYDPHAVSFLALKNGQPVGAARLVLRSSLGFPTERLFNITKFPADLSPARTLELSKLVVKKEFRNGLVSMGLLSRALKYSVDRGIRYWYLSTTSKLIDHFEAILGVDFLRLPVGPPGSEHIKERAVAAKRYFEESNLYPYILRLNDLRKA